MALATEDGLDFQLPATHLTEGAKGAAEPDVEMTDNACHARATARVLFALEG